MLYLENCVIQLVAASYKTNTLVTVGAPCFSQDVPSV